VFGVSFSDLVTHCFNDDALDETWYFRSVGRRPKTRGGAEARELFDVSFPTLAPDFRLAEGSTMASDVYGRLHQSVLRVNQRGMRLWPHYDTLDNVLCQVVGRKRVLLFPPSAIPHLYMHGSTSKVADMDAPDLARYPLCLAARAAALEVTLHPGDVLFMPNMWCHQVVAVDACVSINCFFERLPRGDYDPADAYGNRDIPAQAAARDAALNAVRRELSAISDPEFRDLALQQVITTLSTRGVAGADA
jgi:tRNA wybutosine-synthesizing protein 4